MGKSLNAILLSAVAISLGCGAVELKTKTALAECLVEEKVKFYGAEWCPYCQLQKREFGPGWEIMKQNYIDCSNSEGDFLQRCEDAGIKTVPSWQLVDGKIFKGYIPLKNFSKFTPCVYDN